MRKTMVVIGLTAGLLAGVAGAQEIEPFSTSAMPTNEDYWAKLVAERFERQTRLDQLMGAMAAEMATVRKTNDVEKRQAMMTAHRKHMREAISLMHEMGGDRMRNLVSGHTGTAGDADRPGYMQQRMPPSRPRAEMSDAQRLSDLEIRLDMMQVMLESLMEIYGDSSKGTR